MHILHVVGARPNFMKAAPVYRALAARGVPQTLLHTGQHYDVVMSEAILGELGLPQPDVNLGVGSGTHAQQTAQVMVGVETELLARRPDLVGIQEETTFLGVPCLTMRDNTERPVTITTGTNTLMGRDTEAIEREVAAILDGRGKKGGVPELWDGRAGERIAEILTA